VVFGERHLRHLLLSYLQYYNGARTHLSLNKDAPVPRAVQAVGHVLATPILGGLHHWYGSDLICDRDKDVVDRAGRAKRPRDLLIMRSYVLVPAWHLVGHAAEHVGPGSHLATLEHLELARQQRPGALSKPWLGDLVRID
jgi:hypothetical protein